MDDIFIWSFVGMALMALEIFGVPGIGILFSGFGAITVAVLIYRNPLLNDDIGWQLIYFFMSTTFWAAILWLPLNKFIRYNDNGDYTNIIGTYATIDKELKKGERGKISWSGTKVTAYVDESSPLDVIPEKATVRVINVIEGVFYVTSEIRQ